MEWDQQLLFPRKRGRKPQRILQNPGNHTSVAYDTLWLKWVMERVKEKIFLPPEIWKLIIDYDEQDTVWWCTIQDGVMQQFTFSPSHVGKPHFLARWKTVSKQTVEQSWWQASQGAKAIAQLKYSGTQEYKDKVTDLLWNHGITVTTAVGQLPVHSACRKCIRRHGLDTCRCIEE